MLAGSLKCTGPPPFLNMLARPALSHISPHHTKHTHVLTRQSACPHARTLQVQPPTPAPLQPLLPSKEEQDLSGLPLPLLRFKEALQLLDPDPRFHRLPADLRCWGLGLFVGGWVGGNPCCGFASKPVAAEAPVTRAFAGQESPAHP